MNLGVVRGTVVCEHRTPELVERRLVIVQPLDEQERESGRALVALDPVVDAAEGALVWFVSGSDATDALHDPAQPADAAVVGLVSSIRRAGT
ncbi:MAG TPA: EutN/CcmL family microcompartment protein [Actinomycetota bacterium]|nr:EutN/CcmL family microcompartment protein [Actinomycetota bacterium]